MTLEDAIAWFNGGGVSFEEYIEVTNRILAKELEDKLHAVETRKKEYWKKYSRDGSIGT